MQACNSCGICCTKYSDGGLSATQQEIEMWSLFRPEVSEYVKNGRIWMHPQTGHQLSVCPWLRKEPNVARYSCAIYEDRPDDCKYYPVTIQQMVDDHCEMLEPGDTDNPKQAQITLDKIMCGSRPSLLSR
ncbi:YkgJ family cysteine cluster protein [Aliiglaciecola litoralis]|uniref:YkgJ family cysteine cluster protein n=1 Tax=Aliiglaciecola litoralis TaxID=582857 RepID=A0ABN1LCZ6_9ALTE